MEEGTYLAKPTGIQTAWLLATLGSKMHAKKSIRKEILQISIPEVCEDLMNIGQDRNIRYSSSILYGISLMYKSKVNYFLNDISLIKSRLTKDLFLKSIATSEVASNMTLLEIDGQQNNVKTKGVQHFLQNDPSFDISVDLVPPLDVDDSLFQHCKRRKLEIKQFDQDIFPNTAFHYSTFVENSLENGQMNEFQDTHLQTIENFMDQDLQSIGELSDEADADAPSRKRQKPRGRGFLTGDGARDVELSFEFDHNGDLVARDGSEGNDGDITGLEEFDLNATLSFEGPVIEPTIDKTINNDENFHLSTTDNQTSVTQLQINKAKPQKEKREFHNLFVDATNDLKISSKTMAKSVENYTQSMEELSKLRRDAMAETVAYNDLLEEFNSQQTPFLNYVNKIIFKNKFSLPNLKLPTVSRNTKLSDNSLLAMNSIIKEIQLMSRVPNDADHELGRDVQESTLVEENLLNQQYDFELDDAEREPHSIDQSRTDVFELSFNELNEDELRNRLTSKSSQHPHHSSRLDDEIEHDYRQEDFLDHPLDANATQTQTAKLNYQIIRFLNFLKARHDVIGEPFHLNQIELNRVTEGSQLSVEGNHEEDGLTKTYSKIKFSDLIPNMITSQERGEASINRKLAANSFSSILALASKSLVMIVVPDQLGEFQLLTGDKIEIVVEV
ncbi:uncharacterized protein PRCAT00003841001 [Priceomyces carsonii]|uniref:uncharacterized protein n=1 Tax=Priceomyces carsonii TaxID=28549 RepID=UPI002ED96F66|nr:unnamed protein product [Priceomyces carsonii]